MVDQHRGPRRSTNSGPDSTLKTHNQQTISSLSTKIFSHLHPPNPNPTSIPLPPNPTSAISTYPPAGTDWYKSVRINCTLNTIPVTALLDTGSAATVVSQAWVIRHNLQQLITAYSGPPVFTADDTPLQILGMLQLKLHIGAYSLDIYALVANTSLDCIVGVDILQHAHAKIDFHMNTLDIGKERIPVDYGQQATALRLTPSPMVQQLLQPIQVEPEQRETIEQLFTNNVEAFAQDPRQPGKASVGAHHIDTGDHSPIHQRAYRVGPRHLQLQQEEISRMLDAGIIIPSKSEWASPVILVPKKDGSIRFCVDYRKLNSITRKDTYPLPRIDQLLDALGGAKYFSTMDLASGYWQFPLSEHDKHKTAFITPAGLYQFEVMPFGVCNGPATCQRTMDSVLADLLWKSCLVYLDDIIIYSRTFSEHVQHLQEVFNRLKAAKLHLKPQKCVFFQQTVHFLGHTVSPTGIQMDSSKVQAISQLPPPTNVSELRRFLGMAGYYRRFIRNFGDIAHPLTALTSKNVSWSWTDECEHAFQHLKTALITAPVLTYPEFSKPFQLLCDASTTGVGVVLAQQTEDGTEQVIAYASKTLSAAQRNWTTTERECFAIVYGFQQYRHYLLGQKVTVITDHAALRWLLESKEPTGRLARWLQKLSEFEYVIQHRAGRIHNNADMLSRITVLDTVDIRTEQQHDILCSQLMAYISHHTLTQDDKTNKWLATNADHYVIHEGGLYHLKTQHQRNSQLHKHLQLVVPEKWRQRVIQSCHDDVLGGHLGVFKTYKMVNTHYYWPRLFEDVRQYVVTCHTCQERYTARKQPPGALQPITVQEPWELVGMDILGPLHATKNGNTYILVVTEYLTKWTEAFPMRSADASTVCKLFFDNIIARFGAPRRLLTDQGQQFKSKLLQQLCDVFGTQKIFTSPYHPQTDGQAERFMHTIANMISKFTGEKQDDWDELLPALLFAYRRATNSTTGETPFFLTFGRDPLTPTDLDLRAGVSVEAHTHNTWKQHLMQTLQSAYSCVRDNLQQAHQHNKEDYDSRHSTPQSYQPGDLVMMYVPATQRGLTPKLVRKWTGPYRILETKGQQTYRLADINGQSLNKVIHIQRLKPYRSREPFKEVTTEIEQEQPAEATISEIIQQRFNKTHNENEYLVRFDNYETTTWVPAEMVQHKKELIAKWREFQRDQRNRRKAERNQQSKKIEDVRGRTSS